jgi:hypothetical protein
MPDNIPNKSHRPQRGISEIALPDGDDLELRENFSNNTLGVCDRTVRRMNLPTVYIGGRPFLPRKKSLQIIADRAKRKNQPAKPRRAR